MIGRSVTGRSMIRPKLRPAELPDRAFSQAQTVSLWGRQAISAGRFLGGNFRVADKPGVDRIGQQKRVFGNQSSECRSTLGR
jgi:hypothetical protein